MAIRWSGKGIIYVLIPLLGLNLYVGAKKFTQIDRAQLEKDEAFKNMARFTKVLNRIRENYVDSDKTSYEELIDSSINGMLQDLDPYSQFLDRSMYQDMRDDTAGRFGGLGIVISVKDSVLTIIAPIEDTPGMKAGLISGDKIIEIDGSSTEGMSLPEAVKYLRGDPGSEVEIKVHRPGKAKIIDLTIVREIIKVSTVKGARIIRDNIGYLRITQFNAPTARSLQEAIDKLFDEGMEGLIIDVRENPGGLLSAAIEVAQKFLKRGELIVYTQSRNIESRQTYESRGRHHYTDLPIAVLVNSGSASASEILSGALQDHKRAILIGERTFGKGSVQSVESLKDGSAIRYTTAKYYTPSEKVIHENGIEPDITVSIEPETWHEIRMQWSRQVKEDEIIRDEQLERAIDVLQGVKIFKAQMPPDSKMAHGSIDYSQGS